MTKRSVSRLSRKALSSPLKQIVDNGGRDGSVVVDEVMQKSVNEGFDANTGKYVDMFRAGIIDPVKVVRTALANAASIAGTVAYDRNDGY